MASVDWAALWRGVVGARGCAWGEVFFWGCEGVCALVCGVGFAWSGCWARPCAAGWRVVCGGSVFRSVVGRRVGRLGVFGGVVWGLVVLLVGRVVC